MAKTKPTTITIPTESELADRLTGLDRLLTAKRWERAAIVWAFTTNDGPGQPPKEMPEFGHFPVPMDTFAGLHFAGLSKRDTVTRYRQAWQDAIDQGKAQPVHPGDEVELPDHPWPGTGDTTVKQMQRNPKAMQEAIKASPALREAAVEAIRQHPATMRAISKAAIVEHPEAMREAILESPDVASAAFHAVQESAERTFAGKGPRPDPDDRELQGLWVLRNVLKRTNDSVTEAARRLLDVTLGDDGIQRDIAHYIDMIKLKADLMHSHVHEGAAFDAALQEMLNSEQ